jgi:hypothetical protein
MIANGSGQPLRFIDGALVTDAYLAKVATVIDEILDIEDEFPAWELEEFTRLSRIEQGEKQ